MSNWSLFSEIPSQIQERQFFNLKVMYVKRRDRQRRAIDSNFFGFCINLRQVCLFSEQTGVFPRETDSERFLDSDESVCCNVLQRQLKILVPQKKVSVIRIWQKGIDLSVTNVRTWTYIHLWGYRDSARLLGESCADKKWGATSWKNCTEIEK